MDTAPWLIKTLAKPPSQGPVLTLNEAFQPLLAPGSGMKIWDDQQMAHQIGYRPGLLRKLTAKRDQTF